MVRVHRGRDQAFVVFETPATPNSLHSHQSARALPVSAGLAGRAAPALLTGVVPGPLTPLYLRRPDAVPPRPRQVLAP